MQVGAFSTPRDPDWRWRIVNYAGEILEESHRTYATISLALKDGQKRLREMDVDHSAPPTPYRSTSYLRGPRSGTAS